jgi:hypothetical protein
LPSRYSKCLRAGRSGDLIAVGGKIFRTCPDRPWGPPSLLYNRYRIFPESKERPGCDADPSPPSSAVGHERLELYLYSPYGPSISACTWVHFFLPCIRRDEPGYDALRIINRDTAWRSVISFKSSPFTLGRSPPHLSLQLPTVRR